MVMESAMPAITVHPTTLTSWTQMEMEFLMPAIVPSVSNPKVTSWVDLTGATHDDSQPDFDLDGIGDACETVVVPPADEATQQPTAKDTDGDGVLDVNDNCPSVANTTQADTDGDGIGDACDKCPNDPQNDIDGDGVCGNEDNCPSVYNPKVAGLQPDLDGDGIGDACDRDADDDGYCRRGYYAIVTAPECFDAGQIKPFDCNDRDPLQFIQGLMKYLAMVRMMIVIQPHMIARSSSLLMIILLGKPFEEWLPADGASVAVTISVDGGALNSWLSQRDRIGQGSIQMIQVLIRTMTFIAGHRDHILFPRPGSHGQCSLPATNDL